MEITESPWGSVQDRWTLAEGITRVETASHGGIKLSAARLAEMPEDERTVDGWYEEDAEATYVLRHFVEQGVIAWGASDAEQLRKACGAMGPFANVRMPRHHWMPGGRRGLETLQTPGPELERFAIAWDDAQVEVGPWPDTTGWSAHYPAKAGHCCEGFGALGETEQAQRLLNQAASLVFSGHAPRRVLDECAKIALWNRMGISLPEGHYARAIYPLAATPGTTRYTMWSPHHE